MRNLYLYDHSCIDVIFNKNHNTFIVTEIPLYEFSNEGNHLMLRLTKKNLTTWDAINKISNYTGIPKNEIGYAGLKDKDAYTSQFISIPKDREDTLDGLEIENLKIEKKAYHNNKIRVGHLKGNKFVITLKKVFPNDEAKIKNIISLMKIHGIPNYFGEQRFGRDGENFKEGEEILKGLKKIRDKKKRVFLMNSYQSYMFNKWLNKRIELSKYINNFEIDEIAQATNLKKEAIKKLKKQTVKFKMLEGDILNHYPFGKIFECEDLEDEVNRFEKKDITITGLLPGKKVTLSSNEAKIIEEEIYGENITLEKLNGARRFAVIFPEDLETRYNKDEKHLKISFTLPKGSYATVFLDELLHSTNN